MLSDPNGVERCFPAASCWRFQTCDPAATEKQSSDYFVLDTWGVTPAADLLLLDVIRLHAETTKHMELLRQARAKWRPVMQGVERSAFGLNILQAAKLEGLPIVPLLADTDKVSRARTVVARYEQGAAYHLRGATWLEARESELLAFPRGAHDDQVDTTAYAGLILVESLARAQRAAEAKRRSLALETMGVRISPV